MAECDHGANVFVARYFYDCLYKYASHNCAGRVMRVTSYGEQVFQPCCVPCHAERLLVARSTRDMVGFCLGMSSISCWLFAQLPQFILNAKNQSVEALSAYFLACWLLVSCYS